MRKAGWMAGLLAITAPALADPGGPRWLAIASLPGGGSVEINAAATGTIGGLLRGWWRVRPLTPRPDGTVIESYLEAIDCDGLRAATIETIAIAADGHVLRHDRLSEASVRDHLTIPRPGSYEEVSARALCRMRPHRADPFAG